jgi:primosomal protein N' (replication factor Y)
LTIALAAASRGQALILVPDHDRADELTRRLSREGVWVARYPDGWAAAAAGATVVGTVSAAWAPTPDLAAVVVIDEHDEAYRSESAPTWSGRDVAMERARRAGVPCVLLSPVPSLEALRSRRLMRSSRGTERESWPLVEVVDRRSEDPGRAGLYSPALVNALREGGRVACVLNRQGRSLLLACHLCGELAVCTECGSSMRQTEDKQLACRSGGHGRPVVCPECGSTKMRNLRAGIKRVREEVEALVRTPVAEVTGSGYVGSPTARVVVGTEAVLHLGRPFDVVAFLEFDQELLAPRFRAREQAMTLIARAARITGPREAGGKIVLQTRLPDDPVVAAAFRSDPALLARTERDRRQELGLPPYGAIAVVSGLVAKEFMERFGTPLGVQIAPDLGGQFFLRASDYDTLCNALAAIERPPGRLRIDVDPIRAI